MKICILGSGAWGTAVATVLAHNGIKVTLWCRESDVVESIKTKHVNEQFLPGVLLPQEIIPEHDLSRAINGAELIFAAVPIKFFRSVLESIKTSNAYWVVLNKGIEEKTLLLSSQIIQDVLGKEIQIGALVGPSFAKDLAARQLTGVEIAGPDELVKKVKKLLQNEYFKIELSDDLLGIQICSALKNVITIAIGILDGAGYSDNTKSFLLVKSLSEIEKVVKFYAGSQQTVYGLAGIGDLVLTALGSQSRNLSLGRRLGRGESLNSVLKDNRSVAEGINTINAIKKLIKKNNLTLPVFDGVYKMVYEEFSVVDYLKSITL